MISEKERYIGCLIGLGVGDALGAPVEFFVPGSFSPLTDMVAGGVHNLQRGQFTDDTSMALCLAESILTCRGFDPVDQLERYLRWYKEGYFSSTGVCFDIGNATRNALEAFSVDGQPYRPWGGMMGGNGAIMRLAPVPMAFAAQPEQAIQLCADSSKTTHHFTECLDTCRYLGGLIIGALSGVSKDELLTPNYSPAGTEGWRTAPLTPAVAAIAEGSFLRKEPPQINGGGLTTVSLEAALWAFARGKDFREGALLAVNLGDDADSTGAVYGQLAGAFYGIQDIPTEWVKALWWQDRIRAIAENLYTFAAQYA